MSKHVPDFINPQRAAEGGYDVSGRVSFTRMARLSQLIENRDGGADIDLHFALDGQRIPVVTGRVHGEARLICQRCLEPLAVSIDIEVALAVVSSEEEARRLPPHYDPVVIEDERLAVTELVEDEILLALPAVPRHEDGQCRPADAAVPAEPAAQAKENPFAVLAKLKNKR